MQNDQINPAPPAELTQAELNARMATAPAEAVTAAMGAPAPATQAEHLEATQGLLAELEARVSKIEGVIGAVAPGAGAIAELIPGIGPEVAKGVAVLPSLAHGFNALLAEIHAAFAGKVAGHIAPVDTAGLAHPED